MAHAIDIQDLVVSVDGPRGARTDILKGLSLQVDEGCVFGFLGPNGAGKTTTMHVLLGFMAPTAGSAAIFDTSVRHAIARQRIGFLPERPDTYPFLTGRELLRFTGRIFGMSRSRLRERGDALLADVGMTTAADRRIATYSRGMLQRISLAQALINDPDLVMLDEPTGGLDPLGRMDIRGIIASLRDRGKTVFFSSHELSEVELACDRIAIIHHGRLAAEGRADTLVPAGESLERFFLRTVADDSEGKDGPA